MYLISLIKGRPPNQKQPEVKGTSPEVGALEFHFVISSLFIFLCWLVVIRTRLRLHTSAWALPAQSRTSAKCSRRTSSFSRPSRQTGRHSFAFSSYRSVSLQTVPPSSLVLNAVMFIYIFLYAQNIVSFTTVDRSKPISCKETSAEIESGEKCQVSPLFRTARHKIDRTFQNIRTTGKLRFIGPFLFGTSFYFSFIFWRKTCRSYWLDSANRKKCSFLRHMKFWSHEY